MQEETPYQKYCRIIASSSIPIVKHKAEQSDEMQKVYEQVTGLKQTLLAIYQLLNDNPPIKLFTLHKQQGAVISFTPKLIRSKMNRAFLNKMGWAATQDKLCKPIKNIIDILLIGNLLQPVPFTDLNLSEQHYLNEKYINVDDLEFGVFMIPTYYVVKDIKEAKWENILKTNLTATTPVYFDAVRTMFDEETATNFITKTHPQQRALIALKPDQCERLKEILQSNTVLTKNDLRTAFFDNSSNFGDFHEIIDIYKTPDGHSFTRIMESSFKDHVHGLLNIGWLDTLNIQYITYAKAIRCGYVTQELGIDHKEKIYVNMSKVPSPNLTI